MKKIQLIFFIINIYDFSPTINWGSSTRALMLLDLGTSAEMIGIGNIEGFANGANVLFHNPASMSKLSPYSFSLFTSKIINEISYFSYSGSYQSEYGTFGFGYMSAADDDFIHTGTTIVNAENDREITEKDRLQSSLVNLSYAMPWKKILMLALRYYYIHEKLGKHAPMV